MLRQPAKGSPQRFRSPIQQSEQRSNANVGSLTPPRRAGGFRETGNGQNKTSQWLRWSFLPDLVRGTTFAQLRTEETLRRFRSRFSRLAERSEFDGQSSPQVGHIGQIRLWIRGRESRCRNRTVQQVGRNDCG